MSLIEQDDLHICPSCYERVFASSFSICDMCEKNVCSKCFSPENQLCLSCLEAVHEHEQIHDVTTKGLAARTSFVGLSAVLPAVFFSLFLSGCVITTKRAYQERIGLTAVLAYNAGLNDCGGTKQETTQNVLKRLKHLLDERRSP